MKDIRERLAFLDKMMPFAKDAEAFGRFHADFHDLVEASQWFLAKIEENSERSLTPDEIETFLIDVEVRFIDHATWHFKSLRKEMHLMLAKLSEMDSGPS